MLSSIYGLVGQDRDIYKGTDISENVSYSIIKGGIINLTKQMGSYYSKHNIRVNNVSPGGVYDKSKKNNKKYQKLLRNYSNRCPMKRMAKPEEIADLNHFFIYRHVFLYFWNYTNCRRRLDINLTMKTVIIGYGSIGRKHASVLTKSFKKIKLYICTKQKLTNFRCFKNLNKIKEIQPDYVIIASETSKHYQQLKYLENNLKNTKILVEKPLFHTNKKLNIKNNKVYVGYNLRFHPFILKLKEILKKKNFFDAQFITNSYLPNWRKNISHTKNYSSNKSQGGGIVLDLSHELDIIGSLVDKYKITYANVQKKNKANI